MKFITTIILALCFLQATAQHAARAGVIAGSRAAAPAGTYSNYTYWSEDATQSSVWSVGGNSSISATNVHVDHAGNNTMDELSSTWTSSNTFGQTYTVTAGDSCYFEFDAMLPPADAATACYVQFFNLDAYNDVLITDYTASINSSTVTRLRFGILVPSGCSTLIIRPFGDGSSTGKLWLGCMQVKKVWNHLYITTNATNHP